MPLYAGAFETVEKVLTDFSAETSALRALRCRFASTCTLVRIEVIFPTHMSSEKLISNAHYAGINQVFRQAEGRNILPWDRRKSPYGQFSTSKLCWRRPCRLWASTLRHPCRNRNIRTVSETGALRCRFASTCTLARIEVIFPTRMSSENSGKNCFAGKK